MKCLVHLLLASILLYLSSCSASKRFSSLVKNHPELIDSSMVSDTFLIKGKDSISVKTEFQRFDSLFTLYKDTCINGKTVHISNQSIKNHITNLIKEDCGLPEGEYVSGDCNIKIFKASDGKYYIAASYKGVTYKPIITKKVAGILWARKYWYLFIIAALLGYIAPKILSGIIKSFI